MKKLFKLLTVALSVLLVTPTMSGCGRKRNDNTLPTDKTIIYYHNYDCGYGREYVVEAVERFTEAVKNISYEEGKTGVYFAPTHTKSNATGKELVNGLANNENYVYFTEFTMPQMLKNSGQVMDISSWLTETSSSANASRFAEATSIKDRMYSSWKDYVTESDGAIYCIPLFECSHVFTYDKDLCEQKHLYIKQGSTDTNLTFVMNDSQQKCLGVDGVAGTDDDGLPETYAQLFLWWEAMKNKGITPISYSGMYGFQLDETLNNYWADFEGADNVLRCYSFDGGLDDTLIDVDASGTITNLAPTAITLDNGYMVQKQEGRYRALSIAKKIAENANKWVASTSFSPAETHTGSQLTYVNSKFTESPIMCFAHGSYWEAEATSVFTNYESQNSGKHDRHFGILPIQKYDRNDVGTQSVTTVLSASSTAMFVKKGITGGALDAVKDFVMFFNNQENMAYENAASSCPRPFSYEIPSSIWDSMTDYEKSAYNFYKESERRKIVYTAYRSDFYMANFEELHSREWIFNSKYSDTTETSTDTSVKTFRDNPSLTLVQYFNGLYNRFTYNSNARWNTMLSKIER